MKYLYFLGLLLLLQSACFAQNIDAISTMESQLADHELDACTNGHRPDRCNAIPGTIITTGLADQLDPKKTESQCSETAETKRQKRKDKKKKDKEARKIKRELLLIAELHTFDKKTISSLDLPSIVLTNKETMQPTTSKILVENIFKIPGQTTDLSDDNIASLTAKMIAENTQTDSEKDHVLGQILNRLNANYNENRNPGKNKSHDPHNAGPISLATMYSAADAGNKDKGGVCNDFATDLAMISQKVYPNKDVLVINNGTHYALMIHDKDKGNKIIAGAGTLIGEVSDPLMDNSFPVPTSRILKLDGNVLKQIAVVDNEVGVALKKVIQGQTDALSMGIDPSIVMADYKTQIEKRDKTKTYDIKAAEAQTQNANVLILVAQSTTETAHTETTTAVSVMKQDIKNSPQSNIILGLHTGIQKTVIQYQNPKLLIKASAGAEADLSYGFQNKSDPNSQLVDIMPITATLKLNETIDFRTSSANPMNPSVAGRLQVVQDYGPTNESARQGAVTDPNTFKAILGSMKYMGFTFNQAKADVNVNVPINRKITSFSQLQYQGSNISQNFKAISGFQLVSDGGQVIIAYLGYVGSEKGMKTNSTLSARPSGPIAGGGLKTGNGYEVNANVQVSPGLSSPVQANVGLKKTFGKTKKKK